MANVPSFFLLTRRTEEGALGAGGPGHGGGRGQGERGRGPWGVDSPPQFQRRGPAGRGAMAMAAAAGRRPWAA